MFALNVGLQGVQPVGSETGLADPLRTVQAISTLLEAGAELLETNIHLTAKK